MKNQQIKQGLVNLFAKRKSDIDLDMVVSRQENSAFSNSKKIESKSTAKNNNRSTSRSASNVQQSFEKDT